ncbi:hypothetical protein AT268_32105 [Bacillus cereus]|uniref:Uncharacterized protein n=1 Tax=Bacillus cereus TaxID=1396 RepID=A0A9X0MK50_BACCE|nr:hypothetical protein AT268_32105 [Bacillus cereus]PEZ75298.1 hypothetical protein CN410_14590 [Bacillus anthracis]PFA29483.1 hypothetical protein CN384_07225 [Bacillus thuringiensis]PES55683.1 hypothetical protein CN515_06665 [Bacillus cereus]PGW10619.1 hypothetical protein COD97_17160 [Bacillus cereus]
MIQILYAYKQFISIQYPFFMWLIYGVQNILLFLFITDINLKRITSSNKVRILLMIGCVFFTIMLLPLGMK